MSSVTTVLKDLFREIGDLPHAAFANRRPTTAPTAPKREIAEVLSRKA